MAGSAGSPPLDADTVPGHRPTADLHTADSAAGGGPPRAGTLRPDTIPARVQGVPADRPAASYSAPARVAQGPSAHPQTAAATNSASSGPNALAASDSVLAARTPPPPVVRHVGSNPPLVVVHWPAYAANPH